MIVQKAVENFSEYGSEESNGGDTDGNNTAFNWEASTASEILGLFNGAMADAAAAEASLFLFGKLVKGEFL